MADNVGSKISFFLVGLGVGALAVSYTHLDVYKRQELKV